MPDIDMRATAEQAREFRSLAERLDEQSDAWRQRLAGIPADGERAADLLNHAKLELSRTLVPIASTNVGPYGQDRYGHAWQTQMIPSLVAYPDVAGYDRSSEEFQTWWVAMARARNRVTDALERANEVLRDTLEELG